MRTRLLCLLLLSFTLGLAEPSFARRTTRAFHGLSSYHSSRSSGGRIHTSPRAATGHSRTSHGKIKRSKAARDSFMKSHPCPATGKTNGACPGYVVDHIVPLKRGGFDAPSNMQWQTTADAKRKDKWE